MFSERAFVGVVVFYCAAAVVVGIVIWEILKWIVGLVFSHLSISWT